MNAAERLLSKIRGSLAERPDVLLLDLAPAKGQAPLVGILTRRYDVTRTTGESTFQPFTRTAVEQHGIGFAVETNTTKSPPTRAQIDWRDDWQARGCIFVEAANPQDVWDALGSGA